MVESEITQLIKDYVKLLRGEGVAVERAILYGSRARGDFSEGADIDLALVIKNMDRADFTLKRTLMQLAVRIDDRIEPVAYSSQDYEKDDWLPLLYSIKTTGMEIDISDIKT
jgi:predicted nucleotidyltransferase